MADAASPIWPLAAYGDATGCPTFAPSLRRVRWSTKFTLVLPPRNDGTADPQEFLRLYAQAI